MPRQQPVHRLVEFLLVDRAKTEQFPETRRGRRGIECPSHPELGARIENTLHDHGDDEITLTARPRGEELVEPELAKHPDDGVRVAVRERAKDRESLIEGPDCIAA